MKTLIVSVGALALVPAAAFAASAFDGTWKVDQSRIQLPKTPEIHILKDGEYTCGSCTPPYTIKADGTDQPVAGAVGIDTIAVQAVDANTIAIVEKAHGKVLLTARATAAADGVTATTVETIYEGSTPVVETISWSRVGTLPPGAHAASGTWRATSLALSDNATLVTYAVTDSEFTESGNGESYDAKFDGKHYPIVGSPIGEKVRVKRLGPAQVELQYSVKGKLISISRLRVSSDGQTIHGTSTNVRNHTSVHYTLDKVS